MVFYVAYLQICWYRSLNRVRGKLVIHQLGQKFTAFYINQRFCYRIHKMLSPVQIFGHVIPVHTRPVCYRSVSILSHVFRGLPSGVVPCDFPTKLCICLLCLRATCSPHLVRGFVTLIVFGEDYKPRSLVYFSPSPCCVPSPNIFRRILFSNTFSLCCFLFVRDQILHPHTLNS